MKNFRDSTFPCSAEPSFLGSLSPEKLRLSAGRKRNAIYAANLDSGAHVTATRQKHKTFDRASRPLSQKHGAFDRALPARAETRSTRPGKVKYDKKSFHNPQPKSDQKKKTVLSVCKA